SRSRSASEIFIGSPVSGSLKAESDSTKYDSAHRSSSDTVSLNEGIGVPESPVLMVRKMSLTPGPDLNCPVVRLAGGIGKPRSSFRPAAFAPSPLPAWPWHSQHFDDCHTSLPCFSSSAVGAGGWPTWIGGLAGSSTKKRYGFFGSLRSAASTYLMYWI